MTQVIHLHSGRIDRAEAMFAYSAGWADGNPGPYFSIMISDGYQFSARRVQLFMDRETLRRFREVLAALSMENPEGPLEEEDLAEEDLSAPREFGEHAILDELVAIRVAITQRPKVPALTANVLAEFIKRSQEPCTWADRAWGDGYSTCADKDEQDRKSNWGDPPAEGDHSRWCDACVFTWLLAEATR